MWNRSILISLLVSAVLLLRTAEAGPKSIRSAASIASRQTVDDHHKASFVLPKTLSTTRTLKKDKNDVPSDAGVRDNGEVVVQNPGQTETVQQNPSQTGTAQQQNPSQTDNVFRGNDEWDTFCQEATKDGGLSTLRTSNTLSVKYEYSMFTQDDINNEATMVTLGSQVNDAVALYLEKVYIVDFCTTYLGGGGGRRHRKLGVGEVRAVVPGGTAFVGTDCDAQQDGIPCVRMASSFTVHFADDYNFSQQTDVVGDVVLYDLSTAFASGVGTAVDPNIAGVAYFQGSLGTVDDGGNNGGTVDDGGNNGGTDAGNDTGDSAQNDKTDGADRSAGGVAGASESNSSSGNEVVVEDKMKPVGKFFLSVFILGLIGALGFLWYKLRKVEAEVDGTSKMADTENSEHRNEPGDRSIRRTASKVRNNLGCFSITNEMHPTNRSPISLASLAFQATERVYDSGQAKSLVARHQEPNF